MAFHDPAMDRWQIEAVPLLEALQTTHVRFNEAWRRGIGNRESATAACDQLAAAASGSRSWYLSHPCPNPEAGRHYMAIITAYSKLAAVVLNGLRSPSTDWKVVYKRTREFQAIALDHAKQLVALTRGR